MVANHLPTVVGSIPTSPRQKTKGDKMKLLSAKEVAKLLGINQTTVRVNASRGTYPFRSLRVGALWKFPEEDVMKFLYGEDWKPTDEDRTDD